MKAIEALNSTPASHSLARSSGSFTTWSSEESEVRYVLSELTWRELDKSELPEGVYHPAGICRYFEATEFPGEATQGVSTLGEITRGACKIVEGSHGLEIVAEGVAPKAATSLKLIVGPGKDLGVEGDVVWTWYPGDFTRWTPAIEEGQTLSDLPDHSTVKLAGRAA